MPMTNSLYKSPVSVTSSLISLLSLSPTGGKNVCPNHRDSNSNPDCSRHFRPSLMETIVREDFHLPADDANFTLPQTSFRGSLQHPHVLFLFCTCGWHTYLTRHEYSDSYDLQIAAAISIQETHFRAHHLSPTIEALCQPYVTSSRLRSLQPSVRLAQQRSQRRSMAAISSVFPQKQSLDSSAKPLKTSSPVSAMVV